MNGIGRYLSSSGSPSEERGREAGGVPIQCPSAPVVAHSRAGIGVVGRLPEVAQGYPASSAAVMKECQRQWGLIRLVIPLAGPAA